MAKTATRNMFYDEQRKHVRTKKEILDENGDVRKSCKIVKKGEVYERNPFTVKNKLFKQDDFVHEVKHFYTDLINTLEKDSKEKLHLFDEITKKGELQSRINRKNEELTS